MRAVQITAWASIATAEEREAFNPRRDLPNRKHLKLMTPSVRLGVAAIGKALAARQGWEDVPAERRGLFVGTTPGTGEGGDLAPALEAAVGADGAVDLERFGREGEALVPPLWLVRGLSNNILGFASAYWDLRGVNGNRTEGRVSGLGALVDGYWAVAEGRADLVIAGGADALAEAEAILGHPAGDGAAFVVLEPGAGPLRVQRAGVRLRAEGCATLAEPDLGAADGPVRLVRQLASGARSLRVEVCDPMGLTGFIELAGPDAARA
ncbi:MAG: hypothetical protein JXX28_06060 [Deltaproteobacteria bacterium]|nr:hypothetical protein [Deltaproteobacteria bacterium]